MDMITAFGNTESQARELPFSPTPLGDVEKEVSAWDGYIFNT
jgi:hypothetical protein